MRLRRGQSYLAGHDIGDPDLSEFSTAIYEEYRNNGAVLIRNCLKDSDFKNVDSILQREWGNFGSVDEPFSTDCAQFGMDNPQAVTELYGKVANLNEYVELAKTSSIRDIVLGLLGKEAKIYGKIPLRIDVPVETKELAVWHQDDFYVKGAPNEITAWIPLQDTPMHTGALSVIKKSHLRGKLPHDTVWGKKSMPTGVYDTPINIIEMNRGDVLFFSSYLLHTSNINFSNKIRYSIQIRFTSKVLGEPSTIMGTLYDF